MKLPLRTGASERQRLALALGLGLIVVWASALTVQKQVYAVMSVPGFLLLRYCLLPAFAAVLLCWRHGRHWPRLSAAHWRAMLLAAVLGQVLHVSLVAHGIHRSTAFSSAIILACGPVCTLVTLSVSTRQRLGLRQFGGVMLALMGVLVFLSDKLLRADWSGTSGDLMLLAGVALFSIYSVQVQPLFASHGSLETMCYTTILAAPITVALNFFAGGSVPWATLSVLDWLSFLWISLVVAFGGWMLWGWVSVVRGVDRTAPLMYLLPPIAGIFAWAISGEVFGLAKLAGAALALVGVAISQQGARVAAG
jgi:drug/metabolite transporter (DMT)-like permease